VSGGDAAVAVSILVVFVVASAVVAVVECSSMYGIELIAVSFADGVTAVASLGSSVVDGAIVLNAVVTAFTAAIFAFKSNAFSRRFFFWLRLPCPGPGITEWGN
jgi:hypothetical protein